MIGELVLLVAGDVLHAARDVGFLLLVGARVGYGHEGLLSSDARIVARGASGAAEGGGAVARGTPDRRSAKTLSTAFPLNLILGIVRTTHNGRKHDAHVRGDG